MAYTAVVTKQSVSKAGATLYQVSVKLVVNDGVDDVFEATASTRYNPNAPDMAAIKTALQADLKDKWDKWADEQGIYNATAFDTLVGEIQTATTTYINQ